MTHFAVKLADITIGISSLYEKTKESFREYLTEDAPVFSLTVTDSEIDREREITALNRTIEPGKAYPRTKAALEEQWIYHKIAGNMPNYNVLLFHGSAVAVNGQAYLFAAPSGTGKSTHTRLWRQYFGDRAVMINDDRPLLKCTEKSVLVYGSPWKGKHRLGSNISLPLKAVCLLRRDTANSIAPISAEESFPLLLRQVYRTGEISSTTKVLSLLEQITQSTALYCLGCNTELEAARISYEGMQKN